MRILVQKHNWPFFFENEQGKLIIVNGDRYGATLKEFLLTKIEEGDISNIWFQKDGARFQVISKAKKSLKKITDNLKEGRGNFTLKSIVDV